MQIPALGVPTPLRAFIRVRYSHTDSHTNWPALTLPPLPAYSNATDAAVTFSFTGVAAVYLAERTADRGICLLTLDNSIPYTVDLYNDSGLSSGLQVIWSSGTLPYGQHNISITQIGPDARFG